MKNLVCSSVFLLCHAVFFAQNWSIGAHWVYETGLSWPSWPPPSPPSYTTFTKERDTLVQGRVCSAIREKDVAINSQNMVVEHPRTMHILWQDGPRVWYFDSKLSEFFPLYDFSKNAGDTLEIYSVWEWGSAYVLRARIDSVTQVQSGGHSLKVQWISTVFPAPPFVLNGPIYEGIGGRQHLFPIPGFVDPQPWGWLQCFSDSTLTFPEGSDCRVTVGADEIAGAVSLKIYPNPSAGLLIVEADNVQKISVFDVLGNLVESQTGAGQVSIQHLPDGVYFVAARIGNRDFFRKIVKETR
ncbi:MAG: T9SS type A sorting domain-containing protein [Saprospiraceae bacterium]